MLLTQTNPKENKTVYIEAAVIHFQVAIGGTGEVYAPIVGQGAL